MSAPDSAPSIATNTVSGNIATSGTSSPGEMLRDARERAGMSQDDIAAKLKLSTRQITAIETGDWDSLPERTFTRGFMRSYARIVGLDPAIVGLDRSSSPPMPSGELRPTPVAIGEIAMDIERNSRPMTARWAVPLLLIAVLAAGIAYFQWGEMLGIGASRVAKPVLSAGSTTTVNDASKSAIVVPPSPVATAPASPSLLPPTSSGSVISAAPASVGANSTTAPAGAASTNDVPAAATPAAPAALLAAVAGEKRITITFRGKSWTEVRSKGDVIYSEASLPGTREFTGSVPLSFIIGNASNVSLNIDGKPYDMTQITRNDVARFRIE